jgi:hypothetical protein
MKYPCNARAKHGGRCRNSGNGAGGRCRLHGGHNKGPITAEGKARVVAASHPQMWAGYRAWLERMREAKRLGIIRAIPWGVATRPHPEREKVHLTIKEAALMIIEKNLEQLPAIAKPLEEQTMGELLATSARAGLIKLNHIISLPCEDDNYKLMGIQKDASQSVVAGQIKVDESLLRRQAIDRLPEMLRRIEELKIESQPKPAAEPFELVAEYEDFKE